MRDEANQRRWYAKGYNTVTVGDLTNTALCNLCVHEERERFGIHQNGAVPYNEPLRGPIEHHLCT